MKRCSCVVSLRHNGAMAAWTDGDEDPSNSVDNLAPESWVRQPRLCAKSLVRQVVFVRCSAVAQLVFANHKLFVPEGSSNVCLGCAPHHPEQAREKFEAILAPTAAAVSEWMPLIGIAAPQI